MSGCASVCLNLSEWLFYMFLTPYLTECMATYFNKVCSLKEHRAAFLKRQNFDFFSIRVGSICFLF